MVSPDKNAKNITVSEISSADRTSTTHGPRSFSCNQTTFAVTHRGSPPKIISRIVPACKSQYTTRSTVTNIKSFDNLYQMRQRFI